MENIPYSNTPKHKVPFFVFNKHFVFLEKGHELTTVIYLHKDFWKVFMSNHREMSLEIIRFQIFFYLIIVPTLQENKLMKLNSKKGTKNFIFKTIDGKM